MWYTSVYHQWLQRCQYAHYCTEQPKLQEQFLNLLLSMIYANENIFAHATFSYICTTHQSNLAGEKNPITYISLLAACKIFFIKIQN